MNGNNHRANNRASYARHRDARQEAMRHKRQANLDWLEVYKQSRGCERCGFSHAPALDLHHIDPSTKLYDARTLAKLSRQKMVDEVAKCEVLCANCHRTHHAGRIV